MLAWAGSAAALAVASSATVPTLAYASPSSSDRSTRSRWCRIAWRSHPTRVNSAFRTFSYGVEPLGLAVGEVLVAMLAASAIFAAFGASAARRC